MFWILANGNPNRSRSFVYAQAFGISIVDQFLFSGVQFLLNIALARWLSLNDYGLFTVLFTLFLIVLGFHNAFVVEPFSVFAPRRGPADLAAYERAVNCFHWLSFGSAGLVSAAGCWFLPEGGLRETAMVFSLSAPVSLYLWHRRRACYVHAKPEGGVLVAAAYAASLLAAAIGAHRLGVLNSTTAFLVLAFASLIGISVSHLSGRRPDGGGRPPRASLRATARGHWHYGKWAAGTTLLYAACTHFQTLYAAASLGRESAGVLRACLNFTLPMSQMVVASSLFALPTLARQLGAGNHASAIRIATRISVCLGGMGAAGLALLYVFGGRISNLVYGGKFEAYHLMLPLLAVVPLSAAISAGDGMLVRAANRPELQFRISVVTAAVGLTSSVFLIRRYGVWGAALSMSLSYVATAVVQLAVGKHVRGELRLGRRAVCPSVLDGEAAAIELVRLGAPPSRRPASRDSSPATLTGTAVARTDTAVEETCP